MTYTSYVDKYKEMLKESNMDKFLSKIGQHTFKENSLDINISKYKEKISKKKKNN